MYRLKGRIQPYAWGGNKFIPDLFHLKIENAATTAEYWLGAHPGGITEVEISEGKWTSLAGEIDAEKEFWLGKNIAQKFGRLPFLLKVLDVKDMLSIQVHPTKKAAEEGFKAENEKGIPLNAPNRNYKDDNHKPEVMIALSEFWLLHGFAENIDERLNQYSFLSPFKKNYQSGGIKELYKTLMELSQVEVDALLAPLADSILPKYKQGLLKKSSPDFWAARAFENLSKDGYDKGIFSIYLFNILRLEPGEGIFQGAGMPHAYLEGQNIELMSNSDNVLRAGLTPKYIDIPELLKNTLFNFTKPNVIRAQQTRQQHFECPVPDFNITTYKLAAGEQQSILFHNPAILLLIKGNMMVSDGSIKKVSAAVAFYCIPGEKITIDAESDLYFIVASAD